MKTIDRLKIELENTQKQLEGSSRMARGDESCFWKSVAYGEIIKRIEELESLSESDLK